MRTLVAGLFLVGVLGALLAAPAAAAPEDGRLVVQRAAPAAPGYGVRCDPRATACRRDFGWYPTYRYRCAPPGAACRPPTWRPPYYRRVNYCPNWYGPRCYGRPFPSHYRRSAYYRQVMGN